MKIAILGLGWLGEAFALEQQRKGAQVSGTYRQHPSQIVQSFPLVLPLKQKLELNPYFLEADALILSLPARDKSIIANYENFFSFYPANLWSQIILFNSISVYGKNQGEVDETTVGQASLALELEEKMLENYSNLRSLRLGGLIGPHRHPVTSLSGRELSNHGPINLISQKDALRAIELILTTPHLKERKINLVTPYHPEKSIYYTRCAHRLGIAPPKSAEMSSRQNRIVHGRVLEDLNFAFLDPKLEANP